MEPDGIDDFEEDPVEIARRRGAEKRAAIRLQSLARRFLSRSRLPDLVWTVYSRKYDPEFDMYFYYNKHLRESSWEPPSILKDRVWGEKELQQIMAIQRAARVFLARFSLSLSWFLFLTFESNL